MSPTNRLMLATLPVIGDFMTLPMPQVDPSPVPAGQVKHPPFPQGGLPVTLAAVKPTYWLTAKVRPGRRMRTSIKTTKKRGTRSRFMVWLQVLWSLIEAEAESEDFDPWTDGSDKENHRFKDQQSLALALT